MCMACFAVLKDIDKPLPTAKKQKLADNSVEVSAPRNVSRIIYGPSTIPPTTEVFDDFDKPKFSFGYTRPIKSASIEVVNRVKKF